MGETKIIFLDEPTSSIDPLSRRQIWDIIMALKREGKTILLTTHFLDEAEYLSDKIFILRRGIMIVINLLYRSIVHRGHTPGYQIVVEIGLHSHHKL